MTVRGTSLIWVLAWACIGYTQELPPTVVHMVDTKNDLTDPEILERLEQLLLFPIDINTAKRSDLVQLPWLTGYQIDSILADRSSNGPFTVIAELDRIPDIAQSTIQKMRPFITVFGSIQSSTSMPPSEAKKRRHWPKARWQLSSTRKVANETSAFNRPAVRFDLSSRQGVRMGMKSSRSMEGTTLRMDSAFLELPHVLGDQRYLFGDFALEFGQGLMNGPSRPGSVDGITSRIMWRGRDLSPARSRTGSSTYRGIAIQGVRLGTPLTAYAGQSVTGMFSTGVRMRVNPLGAVLGSTIAFRSAGNTPRSTVGGMDFRRTIGGSSLFGEIIVGNRENRGVIAGGAWSTEGFKGGIRFERSHPVENAVATNLSYRSRLGTVLSLSFDSRLLRTGTFSGRSKKSSVKVRRSIRPTLSINVGWSNEERLYADEKATCDFRSVQLNWKVSRVLRIRSRFGQRRYIVSGQKRLHADLTRYLEARYQPERGAVLSIQWSGTESSMRSRSADDPFEHWDLERAGNTRMSAYLGSQLTGNTRWALQYAHSDEIRTGRLLESKVSWRIQITGTW